MKNDVDYVDYLEFARIYSTLDHAQRFKLHWFMVYTLLRDGRLRQAFSLFAGLLWPDISRLCAAALVLVLAAVTIIRAGLPPAGAGMLAAVGAVLIGIVIFDEEED